MSVARFGRAQKASALLPLAVLSVAWTASLATAGSDASASASSHTLPDGTEIPSQTVKVPASVTPPGTLTSGLHGNVNRIVSTASASGIPAVALAAYQRAATIINQADPTCHMPWQLVAAIGRVESDHGRTGGNVLTNKGIAKPGIYGPVLNGTHGTALIRDTDAGQYDHDTKFDRAVGPMQFIPSTWAIVGVDADNDGQRNPQDIYDASLASAVYLCSGPDNLSTDAGQRASVFRYNHSQTYVAMVLAIMHAYMNGDFTSVPNGTTTTGFTFGTPPAVGHAGHRHARHGGHRSRHHGTHTPSSSSTQPTSGPSTGPTTGPSGVPTGVPRRVPAPRPRSPCRPSCPPRCRRCPPVCRPVCRPRSSPGLRPSSSARRKACHGNPLDPNTPSTSASTT